MIGELGKKNYADSKSGLNYMNYVKIFGRFVGRLVNFSRAKKKLGIKIARKKTLKLTDGVNA